MQCSVIIRAYNTEATIARSMESALAQSISADDFEIIIVDDGSTDGTTKIIEAFTTRVHVRLIRQTNQGATKAANRGFLAARGRYVTLLDADDIWEPTFLAETTALLNADERLDFVYTDYFEVFEGDRHLVQLSDLFQTIADNAVYRTSSLKNAGWWSEDAGLFPEYDVLLRTLAIWKHAHITKPLTVYWRRRESLTGGSERVMQGIEKLLERHPDKKAEISRIRSYTLP